MNNKEFNELVKTQSGRIALIDITHNLPEGNFQINKTPVDIVDKMIDHTAVFDREVLVLFNLEFLERLVFDYKVPVGKISFIADTEIERDISIRVYGVQAILIDKKKYKDGSFIREIQKMGKKFDVVFSNPPYNRNIDLKIIREIEPFCQEMVVVHPSTWAIDMKGKSKLYNDFKAQMSGKIKSLEFFNGNPVFGIGLFVSCMITHIDKSHSGDIRVNYFGEEYATENMDGVTKFGGKAWEGLVKPFYEQMKRYVSQNGSVWDKNVFEIEEGKHYVQLAAIRGNVDLTGDGSEIVKDDFYTMVIEGSEGNKGIRRPNLRRPGNPIPTFPFNSVIEQDNFVEYLKTDFARFCLSLLKNGCDLGLGELNTIPWLDFTQTWDDEKLFAHFGVNEELQNYIREFLPDFHGVRK